MIDGKKALPICILEILKEYSDQYHPLRYEDIIRRLKADYDMDAGRNAISRNISMLCDLGYDICTPAESRKGTYLREREFDDMELLVLMDSVLTSSYIPEGDAKRIIEKLARIASRHFRSRLPDIHSVKEWPHQRNRQFFWTLETLSEAIKQKKQVSFMYNRMDPSGKLCPVRSRKDKVSPYALVCSNSQYYLIARFRGYDNIRHYRVDRITEISSLTETSLPIEDVAGYEHGLDIAKYAAEHNFMYGGKAERILLKIDKKYAGDVVDTFGEAAHIEILDEQTIQVSLFAAKEGMLFWALQFGRVCEVLKPLSLRKEIAEAVREMAEKYKTI